MNAILRLIAYALFLFLTIKPAHMGWQMIHATITDPVTSRVVPAPNAEDGYLWFLVTGGVLLLYKKKKAIFILSAEQRHRALLLRLGEIVDILGPGTLHILIPWLETSVTFETDENIIRLSFEDNEHMKNALVVKGGTVRAVLIGTYEIPTNLAAARAYLESIDKDDLKEKLKAAIASELREIVRDLELEDVMNDGVALVNHVRDAVNLTIARNGARLVSLRPEVWLEADVSLLQARNDAAKAVFEAERRTRLARALQAEKRAEALGPKEAEAEARGIEVKVMLKAAQSGWYADPTAPGGKRKLTAAEAVEFVRDMTAINEASSSGTYFKFDLPAGTSAGGMLPLVAFLKPLIERWLGGAAGGGHAPATPPAPAHPAPAAPAAGPAHPPAPGGPPAGGAGHGTP